MDRIIPLQFNLRGNNKVDKLIEDLDDLFLLIQDAHCAYEIWWILVERNRRKQYFGVLITFKDFFEPIARANLMVMLISLYKLYDTRKSTLSFIKILNNAEQVGVISVAKNLKLKRRLLEVKKTWEKIRILRHNLLAHRNCSMTSSEIYKLAKITPNQIKRMIDLSAGIFNTVWMKIKKKPKSLNEYTYLDTMKMLEALKKSNVVC